MQQVWMMPQNASYKLRAKAWLDYQNDVTVKDVETSVAEGMTASEHLKRWTTQGMATDQGRMSGVTALGVLAEITGRTPAEAGTTTFRPPYTPMPIAAVGAGGRGARFAPVRRAPSHDAAVAHGAPMMEAGLWHRPSYFPIPGETTWRQSCDREVAMVRGAVGVIDVSTLGKIEVGGPDAGAFLDLVYAGRMSTLAEGRVRYGLMLREDGHVMDDGTCARLGPDRWLVTTTTAAAGQVLRHMEFVRQCLRPDMAVRMTSVTDQWAQFAVAGPQAPGVLGRVLDAVPDIPFMGWAPVSVTGIAGRLFRISFSGEMGFELGLPARWGAAAWSLLVAQAEANGGGPYGLEAMEVMRIEKGFLTHREMDGRTTAFDLGMRVRDGSIGAAAATRPGLTGAGRSQLVGLASDLPITAGALLLAPGRSLSPEAIEGHVTSGCWSPTLGRYLGLALVRDGRARHGETLHMDDAMRAERAECLVGPPCAHDPDGTRMRGPT
jgi:sarcosine oxidase subunit alpha